MAKEPSRWVIAYIAPKSLLTLERDILKYPKYRTVTPYIPSIKILVKQSKGKKVFQTVPLLFNYGFFKVPKYFIPNPSFLDAMKRDFECIIGWVKNPVIEPKPGFSKGGLYNPLRIAIASDKEVKRLQREEQGQSFYTKEDVDTLYQGKIITLHTYPFEGLPAEVLEVNTTNKFVRVKLLLETTIHTIKVSFENIFFSMYQDKNMDEKMREEYIEDTHLNKKTFKADDTGD